MVTKKYLCAAPRPESWDDRAQALLKTFGGDVEKRNDTLRQTLQQLRAFNQYERRTGPGRKSNAEHAIAFYEYVLGEKSEDDNDSVEDEENDNEEKDDQDDDDDSKKDSSDHESSDSKSNDDSRSSSSTSRSEEEEEEDTVKSMDSQEFLNQHNDECDVCNLGGNLLCCSTCNLVFHLECVRPVLEKLPEGDWSCAHCIISGSQGHKRHSKAWKSAAAAVRQMGRLRSAKLREKEDQTDENDNNDDEDNNDDDEEKSKKSNKELDKEQAKGEKDTSTAAAPGVEDSDKNTELDTNVEESENDAETDTESNKGTATGESDQDDTKAPGQRKKRRLELYKISDTLNPAQKATEGNESGRSRRPRRQPTLYDPQICPDSRWQSDERAEWVIRESARKDNTTGSEAGKPSGPQNDAEAKSVGTANDKSSGKPSNDDDDAFWCTFCRDDPNVPICVFCACRVCFAKHDKEKILLCDKCDDEYHTFCLSPPLPSVPSTKKWFCPTCNPAATPRSTKARRSISNGTPKTPRTNSDESVTPKSSGKKEGKSPSGTPKSPSKTPTGRPRGRPPKDKSPHQTAPNTPISPVPRKRGRPPKNSTPVSTTEITPPRKRGRPPKNAPPSPVSSSRKKTTPNSKGSASKRSLSPTVEKADTPATKKVRSEAESNAATVVPESDTVKVSRSGRVVKRSSFHDEVEEGEQHLRSTKKPPAERTDSTTASERNDNEDAGEEGSKGEAIGEGDDDVAFGSESAERVEGEDEEVMSEVYGTVSNEILDADGAASHEMTEGDATGSHNEDDEMSEASPDLPVRRKVIEPPTKSNPETTPWTPAPIPNPPVVEAELVPKPETEGQTEAMEVVAPETSKTPPDIKEAPISEPTPKEETTTPEPEPASSAPATIEVKEMKIQAPASAPTPVQGETNTTNPPVPNAATVVPQPSAPPASPKISVDAKVLVEAAISNIPTRVEEEAKPAGPVKVPRRKPGARECMQISRRFGVRVIPKRFMDILIDYCTRGKVEHLIRMRERLDEHSRFLESQLAGLEALVQEKGEVTAVVPPLPERVHSDTPKQSDASSVASRAISNVKNPPPPQATPPVASGPAAAVPPVKPTSGNVPTTVSTSTVTTGTPKQPAPTVATGASAKPTVTAVPPKPAVAAVPPKPAVAAAPPKPAVAAAPPKPAVAPAPPKPAVAPAPPKPAVAPAPPKPAVAPAPPKPEVAPAPPKPAVAPAPPKPVADGGSTHAATTKLPTSNTATQ